MKNVVYPQLREMGVSEADRESLFRDNPKRFFEGIFQSLVSAQKR
jgi:predicted metal-dependent phosphotriesterase family hydrolase